MCVIRRHFLACKDIAGGSDMSAGGTFFREIRWPVWWVPTVRGNDFFHKILVARLVGPNCEVEE